MATGTLACFFRKEKKIRFYVSTSVSTIQKENNKSSFLRKHFKYFTRKILNGYFIMDDKKFYSKIAFSFGIIGLLCSVIMVSILIVSLNKKINYGNEPYIYCSCIILLCFICNRFLYKKGEKNKLSIFGSLFGLLSIIPIVLFFVILFLILLLTPYLLNYTPRNF